MAAPELHYFFHESSEIVETDDDHADHGDEGAALSFEAWEG
jgi:hypothetical protein